MTPAHINPLQWHQAVGYARQACARVYRDGGSAADALDAFGVAPETLPTRDWSKVVDLIAERLCAAPQRRAA